MSITRIIEIVLIVLGLLLVFGGTRLDLPLLLDAGIACLGLACVALGWDAILTRHIVIGSRRRGNRRTYTGVAAVLQGVQFNLIGLFLIGAAAMLYLNVDGRSFSLQMARHPGLPLTVIGGLLLLQSAIVLVGETLAERTRWSVAVDLFILRLLPGTILAVLGLGAIGLGMFEILAPEAFDARGGGMLEKLYGVR